MSFKPISRKRFVKYLESLGLVLIRTKASHELYDYVEPEKKLLRPVTVITNYNEIPGTHVHTNLKTLGISQKEYDAKIKDF